MKSPEDELVIIACVRVADGGENFEARAFAHEGSKYKRVPCPKCEAPMYLGTRSELFLRTYTGKHAMLCSHCATEMAKTAEQVLQTNFAQFIAPPETHE